MSLSENLRVLAIDPGVTTGLALTNVRDGEVDLNFKTRELGPHDHHQHLWNLLCHTPPHIIVCERFDYRVVESKGTKMPGIRLESREYIGVCKLWCQITGMELVMQTPGQAKGLFTDAKLKALGLYQAPSGRQHMNDATRHLLYYITVTLKRTDYLAKLRPTLPTQTED